jgi:hypothetical protein
MLHESDRLSVLVPSDAMLHRTGTSDTLPFLAKAFHQGSAVRTMLDEEKEYRKKNDDRAVVCTLCVKFIMCRSFLICF